MICLILHGPPYCQATYFRSVGYFSSGLVNNTNRGLEESQLSSLPQPVPLSEEVGWTTERLRETELSRCRHHGFYRLEPLLWYSVFKGNYVGSPSDIAGPTSSNDIV